MKRVLTFLAVAALLAVSCNKEQGAISGDAARVTYTVAGPGQVATKTMTMGTIGSDYKLFYEVRLWDGTTLGDALTGDGLSGNKTVAADAWPATVQFDLARGKQYKILFWAQSTSAPEELFSASNLTAIGINYAVMAANNENCDAFSGADVITPSGATAASVTLRRPFALVNLGTSDAVQFGTASGGVGVGNVSAKLSGDIATAFNVATGVAGTAISGSFTVADAPIDASAAATLSVGTDAYNYLSAVYVLPLGASSNIDVEYAIKDGQATPADITSLKVTNVPVKANHRSNIVGKLLTGTTTYSITVDQAFTGDTNKNATPTFASITELNAFFASLISTGPNDPDHGDIYPESVTVTAIPAGDATTITLPNDTLSVAISILAPYAGEGGLTIAYPTASGAKHSNKVFFNMAGLSKLTANLPDTHLEVVSGSDIDLSDVHTSTSTFVIQKGARVGTANIQQGNARIAGAVERLNVVAEATADGAQPGSENAVYIFLEKESAVEKIFLASRTDVVVEQPKDHIDVEATEKKVAVYINSGADNSTAKAQNGGVIYVEANVPCTVTADGTSEAEDGTPASSTVIIESGAAGSEVVAKDGASIDLTANDNCNVTSEGTSDTNVPSTVTVKDVKDENIVIDANTSEGGKIDTDSETAGAVKYYVAQIVSSGEKYTTLDAAINAAGNDDTIKILMNFSEDRGWTIEKNLELDLDGYTITFPGESLNLYPNQRVFTFIGSASFNIHGGTILLIEHEGNTSSNNLWGSIRWESEGKLTMTNVTTCNFCKNGLNVKMTKGTGEFSNNTINAKYGGCVEVGNATATFTNCAFANTGHYDWCSTTVATCNGGEATINSGSYSGYTGVFGFSSGGTINIYGGTFTGENSSANIENNTWEPEYSGSTRFNVYGGTFNGPVKASAWGAAGTQPVASLNISGGSFQTDANTSLFSPNNASILISGGTYSQDPTAYLAEGYIATYDSTTELYSVVPDPSECLVYTPGVNASKDGDDLVFTRVENDLIKTTFAQAVANAEEGQVIKLTKDVNCGTQTINVAGGVTIDFAGHTLTADKVIGEGGKVLFKQSKKYNSVEAAALEVANGYLSYVGAIENVEIWGGTYAFDPLQFTPAGIALVADGSDFEMPGKWFVPSIPEAIVYHATPEELKNFNTSFEPIIWPIKRDNQGKASVYTNHPMYDSTLPVENGAYAFLCEEDESQLTTQYYNGWYADYIVSVDQAIDVAGALGDYPIPSWGIWGAYGNMQYAPSFCFNLSANERVTLLGSMGLGLSYEGIRSFVQTFICGAVNVHPDNVGKVVTAELCIAPASCGDKYYGNMEEALADGKVIVVCKYQYTMETPYFNVTNLIPSGN